jgi:hypothetical protein
MAGGVVASCRFLFGLTKQVYRLLSLSAQRALLVIGASLIDSLINKPLSYRRVQLAPDPAIEHLSPRLYWLLSCTTAHQPSSSR